MKVANLDAYLLFHMDAHKSEYLAPCDERIGYICGFTGSNGLCLTTPDRALMWTDGRYFLQAEKQLYDGWTMMKMGGNGTGEFKPYYSWIAENLPKGSVIGVDENQIPAESFEMRQKDFEKSGIKLVPAGKNLIDLVWAEEDKPSIPCEPVYRLADKYAGETATQKFNEIAKKLPEGCNMMLVSTLDDIAWILNLRGSDINFNPIFFSYLILHKNGENVRCDLFINKDKVKEAAIEEYLNSINVKVYNYEDITQKLIEYGSTNPGSKISVDKSNLTYKFFNLLQENKYEVENQTGMVQLMKAKKNAIQQEGMRQCNIRDCAAIFKYFAFLEEELQKPHHGLNEYNGALKLLEYRKMHEMFIHPSFDTISSMGPNGAVIHYKPKENSCLALNNNQIYLLDSGGQYFDGTTDITRTVHFGGSEPTAFQKEAYTRVLMGTIDLERAIWPADGGYAGKDFDILARQHLFKAGLDYAHGTGHGVGSTLCVHEGPIGISRGYSTKLEVGMCVSDEPGYYQDGEFGIRIENVIMVQQHPKHENRLYFENLTVGPYCRELIDTSILGEDFIQHINKHHEKCLEKLTPLLQDDQRALAYVQRQCAPLSKNAAKM